MLSLAPWFHSHLTKGCCSQPHFTDEGTEAQRGSLVSDPIASILARLTRELSALMLSN